MTVCEVVSFESSGLNHHPEPDRYQVGWASHSHVFVESDFALSRMSLIEANREYVNKMLTEVVGMKALLMDDETVRRTLTFSLLSIF
jgi:hypothetical protein